MNKAQENKLTMHESVDSLLNNNAEKTAEIPAFDVSITSFRADLAELKKKSLVYENATAGKSESKWSAEDDLIESLLPVASALNVIAMRNKNPELREIANVTETFLRRLRDTELVSKSKAVLAAGNENAAELVKFGITAERITDLGAKIDAYEKSIGGRESSVAERMGARQGVIELFAKVDDDLEELDNLMELVRTKYPDFYNEYQAARTVKETGVRHRKAEPAPPNTTPQK